MESLFLLFTEDFYKAGGEPGVGRAHVRRAFAYVASAIMVLVVFQVAVMPGEASEGVSTEEAEDTAPYDSVLTTEGKEGANSEDLNASEPASVVIDETPGGSVESFGDFSYASVSEIAEPVAPPVLSQDNSTISVRTHSGLYVVNALRPWSLALLTHDGIVLVKESYFVLRSPSTDTLPANGSVVDVTPDMIVVEYDVVSTNEEQIVTTMQVAVDFSRFSSPKITATLTKMPAELVGWRIVWIVVPAESSSIIFPEMDNATFSIDQFIGCNVPAQNLSVNLVDSLSNSFSANWSDAGEGELSVSNRKTMSGESVSALQVAFDKEKTEIDPTLVATTNGTTPTELAMQRKVFWYGGYYWAFYDRGDIICYKNSADGQTWGSEIELPEGTAVYAGFGFDVAQGDGKVIVSWMDSTPANHYAKTGSVVGSKILWNLRVKVASVVGCYAPVSVAIGTDGSYFIFSQNRVGKYGPMWEVLRSFDGISFEYLGVQDGYSRRSWNVILPFGNGDFALVETTEDTSTIRVRYWIASYGVTTGWTDPTEYSVGMASGAKGDKWSAVASRDGTLNLALKESSNTGKLRYVCISSPHTGGTLFYWDITSTGISGYPSICLDANSDLHIFYLIMQSSRPVIMHTQKLSVITSDWSTPDVFYRYTYGVAVKGLTTWDMPVGTHAMVWTESDTQVKFGSIPLPYGTPGAQPDPWSRGGLSPYGTYFSAHGDYISPGSGQLSLRETDVSIPSRAGLNLEVSRLYVQPKYFKLSDGTPYLPSAYPYCNLGPGWSLDLPWMDKNFVGIPGGQRFLIMWGNTGDPDVFENHDGVHFALRYVVQSTPKGDLRFYELVMPSGMRYVFDYADRKLVEISDLRGYDIDSWSYSDSCNILWVNYDHANSRIESIEESDLGRTITFSYNGDGNLWKITRPDAKTITFGYTI
ncbi:MAG: hypothetical protein ACUVT7_09170, partial [Thermoplasmata archaeon]